MHFCGEKGFASTFIFLFLKKNGRIATAPLRCCFFDTNEQKGDRYEN